MIYNTAMKQILSAVSMSGISPLDKYPVWKKENRIGEPYWGIGNFCGIDQTTPNEKLNLTDLEWAGNEIYISDTSDIPQLVKQGLRIVSAWMQQMEREYPETLFDILLSVDKGDQDVSPSITLRFWAVRNGYHCVEPDRSELEQFKANPLLMEQTF